MNYTAKAFFFKYAGWSYDPKTQTNAQGHSDTASKLACAEEWAAKEGYVFEWNQDDITNREFADNGDPEYYLWCVVMRNADSDVVQSLGGVDFGAEGDYSDPYARVCQAELALEQFHTLEAASLEHNLTVCTDGG